MHRPWAYNTYSTVYPLRQRVCTVNPSRHATPSAGDLHLSGSDVGVRERNVSWNLLRPLVSAAICGLASAPLPWVTVAQQ